MEKNIFRKIQLAGAKRSDQDWHITCWGYKTMDELMNNLVVDCDEFDEVNRKSGIKSNPLPPRSEFHYKVDDLLCLQPYKNEPKQKTIKSYFAPKEKNYVIEPFHLASPQLSQCDQCASFDPYKPSTSKAYREWVQHIEECNPHQRKRRASDSIDDFLPIKWCRSEVAESTTIEEALQMQYDHLYAEVNEQEMINASIAGESKLMNDSQYAEIDEIELLNATIATECSIEYQSLFLPIEDQELIDAAVVVEKTEFSDSRIADFVENMAQVEHKRNLVQIRKVDRLDNFSFRIEFSDLFWPIEDWPPYAVKVLSTNRFAYEERLVFATFLHGNGMRDTELSVKILQTYNRHIQLHSISNQAVKIKKFIALFEYLEKSSDLDDPLYHHIRDTYYYYDMQLKRMVYYSGDLRISRTVRRKFTSN